MTKVVEPTISNDYLDRVIMLLPGYDPHEQSEGYYFDYDAARDAIGFIEDCCTHVKGQWAGQPLLLEDWQRGFIANLVGWKSIKTGLRRYRKALLFVPRKNGKSIIASALQTWFLFCDGERGAENYSVASDYAQARIVWEAGVKMIKNCAILAQNSRIYSRSVVIEGISSFWKPFSGSPVGKHGLNPHFVNIDELHEIKDDRIIEAFETGFGARSQPMLLFTTTSDIEQPSPCNKVVDHAKLVRDNVIHDPQFLPGIWETTLEDDWQAEETWAKANPNLGISPSIEFMRAESAKARQDRAYENTFKRLYLNIRAQQSIRYIKMHEWDKCPGKIDLEFLKGRTCFGGLDLASIEDLAAFVLCFPPVGEDDPYILLPHFWVPADNAEVRSQKVGVDYMVWGQKKLIRLTEGTRIDYDDIFQTVKELGKTYFIQEIAYDPWNAEAMVQRMTEAGISEMINFPQTPRQMTDPIKQFNRLVGLGRINHGGHEVLRWNAGNFAVKTGTGAGMQPDKKHLGEKFDGIVASIMAVARAMLVDDNSEDGLYFVG